MEYAGRAKAATALWLVTDTGPQETGIAQKQTKIHSGFVTFITFCRIFP